MGKLKKYKKSTIVRKAAHFSMYALIGGIAMIVIYSFSKKIFLAASVSFILSVLYAVFDEKTQIAVDGRNGNIMDVFIDSSGALVAITILLTSFFMVKTLKKIISKK